MKKRFACYTVGVRAIVGDCVQTEYTENAVVEGKHKLVYSGRISEKPATPVECT